MTAPASVSAETFIKEAAPPALDEDPNMNPNPFPVCHSRGIRVHRWAAVEL